MSIRSPLHLFSGLVCAIMLFLSANAGGDRTMAQVRGCFEIAADSVMCKPGGGYTFSFRLRNQSGFSARSLAFRVADPGQGVTVSPGSVSFPNNVAPNQLSGTNTVTISGNLATAGRTVMIIGTLCSPPIVHRDSSTGGIDTTQECCTDTILVRLPQCGTGGDCARIDYSSITCIDNGYRWCFTAWNYSNRPVNQIMIQSGTNGTVQTVSVSPALNPGASRNFCVDLARGQAGATVTNKLYFCWTVIRDTIIGGVRDTMETRECCTTSASVKLPECNTTVDCAKFGDVRVECDSTGGYVLCFAVQNASNRPKIFWNAIGIAPSGFLISPSSGALSPPLAPGSSRVICVRLSGQALQGGGSAAILFRLCDSLQNCCIDTLEFKLPRCGEPSHDCCTNFRKTFQQVASSGSSSGFAALNGFLSAGPQLIKSVSASLVSVTVNGQPAYGYFNFGLLLNSFGVGTVTPGPFGQEVIWPGNGTGVNMTGMTQFFLSMKFPPIATNLKRDTLVYCVKFRYTDVNCQTCDTTLCFRTIRVRFNGGGNIGRKTEKDGGSSLSAGGGVSGEITGANSATMKIVFPEAPAELGPINYVGLRVVPNDNSVMITSVSSKEPGRTFTVANGLAMSSFSAKPGDVAELEIGYANLGGRRSLEHRVAILYTRGSGNDGIFEEEMIVTLSKSGPVEKDTLVSTHSGLTNAYTFAVHLNNGNGSKEPISRMVITTEDEVRIVAVGPTADDNRATLQFGTLNDGSNRNFVGEIVEGGQVEIAPSSAYGPIYLTLVGPNGEVFSPRVHFTTLNANGQVISEGEVMLTDPAAGVTRGDGSEGASGAMLRQSFPNPALGSATIQFRLPASERGVTLVVTDVKGREVARLIDGESLTAGEHAAYLETSGLAAGTYYYTLRVGNDVETRSMQIVK